MNVIQSNTDIYKIVYHLVKLGGILSRKVIKHICAILLLFQLMFINTLNLNAQILTDYSICYGINDGLPQSSVFGIIQSRDGFMWFTTGDGIVRFDGKEWRTFRNNFQYNGKPASNLYNSNLLEDSLGTIWFTNSSGIFYKEKGNDSIKFFAPNNDTIDFTHT
ncbi:MAG: hypothetical protein FGM54_09525, partial [Chitinophagaceae bacterium]|nr:hypothetical protein [Chitinophagaceae bacterium]